MGVSGTLEYISDLMSSGHKYKKKRKQLQTVDLKVRMDCDGCELKVKNALSSLSGNFIFPSSKHHFANLVFLAFTSFKIKDNVKHDIHYDPFS